MPSKVSLSSFFALSAGSFLFANVAMADAPAPENNNSASGFKSNFVTSKTAAVSDVNPNSIAVGGKKPIVTDPDKKQSTMGGTKGLPESQVLLRHDNVAPGLSRTQAMELESQYGRLPRYAEQDMKNQGLLKDAPTSRGGAVKKTPND